MNTVSLKKFRQISDQKMSNSSSLAPVISENSEVLQEITREDVLLAAAIIFFVSVDLRGAFVDLREACVDLRRAIVQIVWELV